MQQMGKPRQAIENIQPKQATARPLSNILPSNAANIRPASSVSTQTGGQLQSQVNKKKKITRNLNINAVKIAKLNRLLLDISSIYSVTN